MNTRTENTARRMARELVPMVNAYLITRANAEVWRGKMDDWDRAELERFEYLTAEKHRTKGYPERITEPKRAWRMSDEDAAEYYKQRQYFVDSLKVPGLKDGYCPALVAERLQQDAEHLLIESASHYPGFEGLTVNRILCAKNGLDRYREYIDLLCNLVVNAPGYRPPGGRTTH